MRPHAKDCTSDGDGGHGGLLGQLFLPLLRKGWRIETAKSEKRLIEARP